MRKLIYLFLDILLIFGALASIATINGGRWISTVLAFYEPTEIVGPNHYTEFAPEGTGGISAAESKAQTASDCLVVPMPSISEWNDANAIFAASNGCGSIQATPANKP